MIFSLFKDEGAKDPTENFFEFFSKNAVDYKID